MHNFLSEKELAAPEIDEVLLLQFDPAFLAIQKFRRENAATDAGSIELLAHFRVKVDALKLFWRENGYLFPLVAKVYKAYFSSPVSSAKAESTFSYSGEVVTKK